MLTFTDYDIQQITEKAAAGRKEEKSVLSDLLKNYLLPCFEQIPLQEEELLLTAVERKSYLFSVALKKEANPDIDEDQIESSLTKEEILSTYRLMVHCLNAFVDYVTVEKAISEEVNRLSQDLDEELNELFSE